MGVVVNAVGVIVDTISSLSFLVVTNVVRSVAMVVAAILVTFDVIEPIVLDGDGVVPIVDDIIVLSFVVAAVVVLIIAFVVFAVVVVILNIDGGIGMYGYFGQGLAIGGPKSESKT